MSDNHKNGTPAPYWDEALEHLRRVEPAFETLVERFPGERIRSSGSAFQVLANSIVGQQISVKAASAIFGRLTTLLGAWVPEAVSRVSDEQLRTAGLSVRKVEYFRGLAAAFTERTVDPARWAAEPDAQVIKELVALRGIGRWTAEMFLIFFLQRPDVLPLDDLGLLQSAARVFGWEYPFDPQILSKRAEAWRPWRTVGTWYLWRALDPEPVVY
jgi:DNA-3-methyladenine glycosylase II